MKVTTVLSISAAVAFSLAAVSYFGDNRGDLDVATGKGTVNEKDGLAPSGLIAGQSKENVKKEVIKAGLTEAQKVNSLLSEFNNIKNGRSFVLTAWGRPEEGGRYYAAKFINNCIGLDRFSDVIKTPQLNMSEISPENQTKAIAAANRLHELCSQFTEDDYKKYSSSALFESKNATEDVLVRLQKKISEAKSSSDYDGLKAAMKSVLDVRDPLLVDDLGARLSMNSKQGGFYLAGKSYKPKEAEELLAAYYLLPCGLGLSCDALDPTLSVSCISGNTCFDNRFEKARVEMVGGDNEKYQRVLAMQRAMVQAFQDGNVSFFMNPEK